MRERRIRGLHERAGRLLACGENQRALETWAAVATLDPSDVEAHLACARILAQQPTTRIAGEAWRRVLDIDARNAEARQAYAAFLSGEARALFERGDFAGAEPVLRQALGWWPGLMPARLLLCKALVGQIDSTIPVVERVAMVDFLWTLTSCSDAEVRQKVLGLDASVRTRVCAFISECGYHLVRLPDFELLQAIRALHRAELSTLVLDREQAVPPDAKRLAEPLPTAALQRLQSDGNACLGQLLSPAQVEEILAHLPSMPCYNGHIYTASDGRARFLDDPVDDAAAYQFACYLPHQIAALPYLKDLALSQDLLALAEQYLGCPPILDLQLWWAFPGDQQKVGPQPRAGQDYHRDYASFLDLQFFVPLTALDEDTGPHYYVRKTHRLDALREAAPVVLGIPEEDRLAVELFADRIMYPNGDGYGRDAYFTALFEENLLDVVSGPAGVGHIEDTTAALHKGEVPPRARRLMFSVRFKQAFDLEGMRDLQASGGSLTRDDYILHFWERAMDASRRFAANVESKDDYIPHLIPRGRASESPRSQPAQSEPRGGDGTWLMKT